MPAMIAEPRATRIAHCHQVSSVMEVLRDAFEAGQTLLVRSAALPQKVKWIVRELPGAMSSVNSDEEEDTAETLDSTDMAEAEALKEFTMASRNHSPQHRQCSTEQSSEILPAKPEKNKSLLPHYSVMIGIHDARRIINESRPTQQRNMLDKLPDMKSRIYHLLLIVRLQRVQSAHRLRR